MNQLHAVARRVRYNTRSFQRGLISGAPAKIDYLSAYPCVEPAGKIPMQENEREREREREKGGRGDLREWTYRRR